jgi:hypothetical protein
MSLNLSNWEVPKYLHISEDVVTQMILGRQADRERE